MVWRGWETYHLITWCKWKGLSAKMWTVKWQGREERKKPEPGEIRAERDDRARSPVQSFRHLSESPKASSGPQTVWVLIWPKWRERSRHTASLQSALGVPERHLKFCFSTRSKAAPGPGLRASLSTVLLAHKPLIGKTLLNPPSPAWFLPHGRAVLSSCPCGVLPPASFTSGPLPWD